MNETHPNYYEVIYIFLKFFEYFEYRIDQEREYIKMERNKMKNTRK